MPNSIPKTLSTATVPYKASDIRGKIKEMGISDALLAKLEGEGFPASMVLAFLYTAATTNTVVSSRTPGGVGTVLIEQGYDLKGFQIKCKSCNWGPMAGFLCQLPFLNKEGYEYIGYNMGYIVAYQQALTRFDGGDKLKIAEKQERITSLITGLSKPELVQIASLDKLLEAGQAVQAAFYQKYIPTGVWRPGYAEEVTAMRILDDDNVRAIYAGLLQAPNEPQQAVSKTLAELKKQLQAVADAVRPQTTTAYRETEKLTGKWSGENTIPKDMPTPFIQIKRTFAGQAPAPAGNGPTADLTAQVQAGEALLKAIKSLNGVVGEVKYALRTKTIIDTNRILGTACNAIKPGQENTPDKSDSSIKLEFLLQRDAEGLDVWKIYGGATWYRKVKNPEEVEEQNALKQWTDWQEYDFKTRVVGKELEGELGIKLGGSDVAAFQAVMNQVLGSERESIEQAACLEQDGKKYYPLCGIMNPHPPYGVESPDFYKNAVSGDFDLFAFWPSLSRQRGDITRLTERTLGQSLKLFTNEEELFYLDFIPGFTEIVKLQENPERGNINNLGELVGGTLNSLAARLTKTAGAANKTFVAANMAFHSDEGGRPGIMEIEFPVAVFLPDKLKTATLGKAVDATAGTAGGLIETNADLVQLLLDINYEVVGDQATRREKTKNYTIIIHSEWMMHLLFIALISSKLDFDTKAWFTVQPWFGDVKKKDSGGKLLPEGDVEAQKKRAEKVDKKVKEFITIKKNHEKSLVDTGQVFDGVAFVHNLKVLLRGKIGEDGQLQELSDATFTKVRDKLLELAFYGDIPAMQRQLAVMDKLYEVDEAS